MNLTCDPGRAGARRSRTTRPTPATSPSRRASDRGSILTRDGVVLAESVPAGRASSSARYPEGTLAAHIVGYYSLRYGRAGIEAAANDALAGQARLPRLAAT